MRRASTMYPIGELLWYEQKASSDAAVSVSAQPSYLGLVWCGLFFRPPTKLHLIWCSRFCRCLSRLKSAWAAVSIGA